jgi:hypothetical protein
MPADDLDSDVLDVGPEQTDHVTLRAEWDTQNRCWVALFNGEKPLEKWRSPSREEWEALRARGKLVRPGAGGAMGSVQQPAADAGWGGILKKYVVPIGLLGVAAWGASKVVGSFTGDDASGDDMGDELDDSDEVDDIEV